MLILFAAITQSIIGFLDSPPEVAENKVNIEMREQECCRGSLRVMSFNMLFDCYDKALKPENRWPTRKARIVEYIEYAKPDVIGSQELQANQRADLMEALGDQYDYCGEERAIFYNKERLQLVCSRNLGRITTAVFEDCHGGSFTIFNTHFSFTKVEKRLIQAKQLARLASTIVGPLIVTGDMNSFPMRPELALPFYDGDYVMNILESGDLKDARQMTVKGHFGPIATTNFSSKTKESFSEVDMPGVILDHILINPSVKVRTHGIDPARVDGHFISDHLPVVADVVIRPE